MYNILICGVGEEYLEFTSNLSNAKYNIVALVDIDKRRQNDYTNGKAVFNLDKIKDFNYNYIAITYSIYDEIVKHLLSLGIEKEKLITLYEYNFCLDEFFCWSKLKNKNFSIISDDCWGGYVYQKARIMNNSPFMWSFFPDYKQYLKLVKNVRFYLNQDLTFIEDPEFKCPVGMLADVKIVFNHYKKEEEALEKWNRRKVRFNFNNIFVKMSVYNEEQAIEFNNLNIKNKIAFSGRDYNIKSCIYLKGWEDINNKIKYENIWTYILRQSYNYFDIVEWLNSGTLSKFG